MKLYSHQRTIQQLVKLMTAHRVADAVLCPGSRNAPLIETIAAQAEIHSISVADERSAGFQAIGISLMHHRPVAVVCTSGSALANLLPAVSEAYYREIPLLIISADRPQALIGQTLGQTLPQPALLGTLTRYAVNLPEIHNDETEWYSNRLINDALLRLQHPPLGPIHINIPLSEPLFEYAVGTLPDTRAIQDLTIRNTPDYATLCDLWTRHTKRMILIGQYNPTPYEEHLLTLLCRRRDCIVFGDAFSNTVPQGAYPINDTWVKTLSHEDLHNITPDFLITMGGQIVSKHWRLLLQNHPPRCHLGITQHIHSIDPYRSLSHRLSVGIAEFLETLLDIPETLPDHYIEKWTDIFDHMAPQIYSCYSNHGIIEWIISSLPPHAVLHIGNSSLARDIQEFSLPAGIKCHANRGTNGIEGSVSVAMGAALKSKEEQVLIIGDMSFFYDMNALWKDHIPNNFTIFMLNNEGGAIFKNVEGMKTSAVFETFVAYHHHTTAKGWALETGFRYHAVHNEKELQSLNIVPQSLRQAPLFIEIFMPWDNDNKKHNQ